MAIRLFYPGEANTEPNPDKSVVERIGEIQVLGGEKTFDSERKLSSEIEYLQIDVADPIKIDNPQPKNLATEVLRQQDIKAEAPIVQKIVKDQLDFVKQFSTNFSISTGVPESIPDHQKSFGVLFRVPETPGKTGIPSTAKVSVIEKIILWIKKAFG